VVRAHSPALGQDRTNDQTLHLVFANDLDAKRVGDPVIILERAAARRHDAKVARRGAIGVLVVGLQLAHKFDAGVYPVRLELEEVEAPAHRIVAGLTREVDQLGERAADLRGD
jgi:hypothetical protein